MGEITVVLGPPCGGKSTHVEQNAQPGDVRIDYDKLALALGSTAAHSSAGAVRSVTFAARTAAINEVLKGIDASAWIIHTNPAEAQMSRYRAAGAEFVTCDPGLDACLERAAADKRPDDSVQGIHAWYGAEMKRGHTMNVTRKDATITNTDDTFPGAFEVILSAPTKDRDGDTLLPEDWKQPLPDHITFDADHGMSVATTVGSGVPRIDEATGNLIVSGTYSSLPRAQEVRTLVNEGHIRTTSVAFMSEPSETKDGKKTTVRELLNGAFVAIPSNREALVLASKGLKAGARNSAADAALIQTMHDATTSLGADCSGAKALEAATETKDADTEAQTDPGQLAQAVDAALDEAINLFAAVDASTLPAEAQQALALVQAADAAVDELLDALGVQDPDEDTSAEPATVPATAPAKAAALAETKAAEDDELQTRVQALSLSVSTYTD